MKNYIPELGDYFVAKYRDKSFSIVVQCVDKKGDDVIAYYAGPDRFYFNHHTVEQYYKIK